ncbi:hypothetical protein Val02_11250 [Virgisporangium aliadipatigenens]|uniref:Protein arginine N-methyltransferase 1 n=2 Tax=Virgisporangium aliadipatigenens TaxID=741659 RepID=A0A8J3YFJ8_9ACTN|nr:hypothetical protein Val02_11250 [Virgisporangium aliadipatigenens]
MGLWPSVGEYPCYDPYLYFFMSNDTIRNEAFRTALAPLVDGRTVLDIGTGRDLNWAMEAARHGARLVIAVEEIEDSYRAALQRLVKAAEVTTIDLFRGRSFDLEPPQRAEVCVAELIGNIASSEGMLAVMADARTRLLTPDAVVVPAACATMIGAMSLRSLHPGGPAFSYDGLTYLQQVFERYGRAFDIRLAVTDPDPAGIVSTAEPVESLTFDGSEPCESSTKVRLTVERAGEIDGFMLWIRLAAGGDARVLDSLTDRTSWSPVYLPVFDPPVEVHSGETVDIEFSRRTSDDGIHPDYLLRATLATAAGTVEGSYLSAHHGPVLGGHAIYRELWGIG